MNDKELYYQALKKDNGKLDEITLGETIGLTEVETVRIISMLLTEYKIDFVTNRACQYRIMGRLIKH